MSREQIWGHMEELEVPCQYTYVISHMCDQVIHHMHMKDGTLDFFTRIIGVCLGYPLSQTLLDL